MKNGYYGEYLRQKAIKACETTLLRTISGSDGGMSPKEYGMAKARKRHPK
jgi:hypothetical protein